MLLARKHVLHHPEGLETETRVHIYILEETQDGSIDSTRLGDSHKSLKSENPHFTQMQP